MNNHIMDNLPACHMQALLRGGRLALHLLYGMLLAIFYPHLPEKRQRRMLKTWSRQLLGILNIGLQIEGPQPMRGEGGCLIVANHVSWLDIFVLNAIHPARFIAKAEVRGWLSKRCGTIFIERAQRQDAAAINHDVSSLLGQGVCVGLFPEGTSSDGKQVGHFHSALIQPAIDAGARICPIALRYQDERGELSGAPAFIGDTTLIQSIWNVLCCSQLNTLVAFTPALPAANKNRRELARAAQAAIAQELASIVPPQRKSDTASGPHLEMLSAQSAYSLLLNQVMSHMPK